MGNGAPVWQVLGLLFVVSLIAQLTLEGTTGQSEDNKKLESLGLGKAFQRTAPHFFTFVERIFFFAALYYIAHSIHSVLYAIVFYGMAALAALYLIFPMLRGIRNILKNTKIPTEGFLGALSRFLLITLVSYFITYLVLGFYQVINFVLTNKGIP